MILARDGRAVNERFDRHINPASRLPRREREPEGGRCIPQAGVQAGDRKRFSYCVANFTSSRKMNRIQASQSAESPIAPYSLGYARVDDSKSYRLKQGIHQAPDVCMSFVTMEGNRRFDPQ